MWKQTNIFGEKLELPSKQELSELCCESCYTASELECACKCHGAYHGLGNLNRHKIACENAARVDGDRVFCSRTNDWISTSYCQKCSPERKQPVHYEW